MRFDFITIGGAVEDITLYTDKNVLVNNKKDILRQKLVGFEYGAKIVIEKSDSFFGGGASNAAVSLSRLGFKTAILANIGNDERGSRIEDNFKKEGVNLALLKKSKKLPTGFSIIVVGKDSEHVAFTVRGANKELDVNFLEKKTLNNSSWLYISSLSGKWEDLLLKIFNISGPKIIWNPGGSQLSTGAVKLKRFFKKTDILIVNKDEAIELAMASSENKGNKFLNNVKNLLEILKSFGPEIAVITSGKNGADAFDGDKVYHKDSIVDQKKIIDTTGVGDAFCSAFAAGLEAYEGDIKKAMDLAMRNATSVLEKAGAQNGLLKIPDLKK